MPHAQVLTSPNVSGRRSNARKRTSETPPMKLGDLRSHEPQEIISGVSKYLETSLFTSSWKTPLVHVFLPLASVWRPLRASERPPPMPRCARSPERRFRHRTFGEVRLLPSLLFLGSSLFSLLPLFLFSIFSVIFYSPYSTIFY